MFCFANGLLNNLASVRLYIALRLQLTAFAIPVASATAVVIFNNPVECINSFIAFNEVSYRFNANPFPDAPLNFLYRQDIVGADRRL